ncbi:MAG: DNA-directed RNA polymerase subunit beta', partial [Gemmatimonadaceae bacterium]|nr:DNA-directed RNA polymerase subunit beta' [Gemmatimonadaceae bacterium]
MIDFRSTRETRASSFDYIQVRIASPEEMRGPKDSKERERLEMAGLRTWWSWGEVLKPETINYRSFKPEKDGLFCERIFGPVKDWECHCGKYKRIRYRGVICDRCGVEVTLSRVRRERMGHIELAVPVAHIWFFKTLPSPMGNLVDLTLRDLEKVIYYSNYVVIDAGKQESVPENGVAENPPRFIEANTLISEDEYIFLRQKAKEEGDNAFMADIGAPAVRELLKRIDVDKVAEELRAGLVDEGSQHRKKQMLKRLKVVDAFRNSGASGQERNKAEWLIMDVIPVIPPDLRPLVPLDGGRFATSDLNDLYRRVINRNNRLMKLISHRAPEVILRNEKRMLQEAVDALFDNGRRSKAIRGRGKRPLKSLSDMLKGKQGRFRQNLLGKRVDYSGRSVIVVGPELKLHQCGLPKAMALELFKPFIIHKLVEKGIAETVKRAKKIVEKESPEVYEILEEIIRDHPVLLNRAPTLHRLGIQAFEPVLVEGKAIRIHPLVCAAFNADFDGDQMAVHVPLSFEAQLECRLLMLSSNNILKPSDGRPVAEPSQDIVLGCYYATKAPPRFEQKSKTAKSYSSASEVELALSQDRVTQHTPIRYFVKDVEGERWIDTTVGRVLFNAIIPKEIPFQNKEMKKKALGELVFEAYRRSGLLGTVPFLDRLKEFGFRYATRGGISIGIEDLHIPAEKETLLGEAEERVNRFQRAYQTGNITNGERYNKVIDTWTHANNDVADAMVRAMRESHEGFNPVFMMFDSGSRGSRDQIRQLAGMRGLMAKPQKKLTGGIGEIIESPIKSNFRDGLSVLEYFISTHGARKGLADTALKTADAGYLTRRLVDVAQDVTITEEDCGTILGLEVGALKEGEDIIEPLAERIVGTVASDDIYDVHEIDESGQRKLLVEAGQLIDEDMAQDIEESGLETVKIRSVLTCEAKRGLCQMCYGRNLATMAMVDKGEAVGIIAAQSIGEPGTQLTLRTFHIGGTAARIAEQTARKSKVAGTIEYSDRLVTVTNSEGVEIVTSYEGELTIKSSGERNAMVGARLQVPLGATLMVKDGDEVKKEQIIFTWDPYTNPIIADVEGTIRFVDLVPEESVSEELDELTGLRQTVVIEDREKKLHPHIEIWESKGAKEKRLRDFVIPVGAQLTVEDGKKITAGTIIAKISREAYKTRDITGGLPRVAELFEARRPKDPATISEIDGVVRFGDIKRGKREIRVVPENAQPTPDGEEAGQLYEVAAGKHLRVHEGDRVRAGDRLSEGPVNPHDILRIKGPRAVQEYLLNEVQEVYRLQGVKINDKHIGVIVRQMLQKVRVLESGETMFLEG